MKPSVLYTSQGRTYKELLNLFQLSSFILMGIQLQGICISLNSQPIPTAKRIQLQALVLTCCFRTDQVSAREARSA